jgi:hypothetical protein
MARPTLLDLLKQNGADPIVGVVDEAGRIVPEISGMSRIGLQEVKVPSVGMSRTIKGTGFPTCVRTAVASSPFRDVNEGVVPVVNAYERRTVETYVLNPRWECDKAIADRHEDGPLAYCATEAEGILRGAFMGLGTQFYYGRDNGGGAKGHPGLIDGIDASHTIDAGGTTASTGSSVWAVRFGPQAVQWVLGENGQVALSDLRTESIADGDGNRFTAYIQEILAYVGLQIASVHSLGRIKKLTADSGKTLTDDLISDLLATFPVGHSPDCLFMSRRSLKQLQQSRTATNATGAPAPFPTESFGVPILPSDSILDTESLTM